MKKQLQIVQGVRDKVGRHSETEKGIQRKIESGSYRKPQKDSKKYRVTVRGRDRLRETET